MKHPLSDKHVPVFPMDVDGEIDVSLTFGDTLSTPIKHYEVNLENHNPDANVTMPLSRNYVTQTEVMNGMITTETLLNSGSGVLMTKEEVFRGIHKVQEEMHELGAELSRLCVFPNGIRPTQETTYLPDQVANEIADVLASLDYFIEVNHLSISSKRRLEKLQFFHKVGLTGILRTTQKEVSGGNINGNNTDG